jgi:hypothetical protein
MVTENKEKTRYGGFKDYEIVDGLIKDHRIPIVHTYTKIIEYHLEQDKTVIILPPKGTTFEDTVIGDVSIGYEYLSPQGKSRGKAEWIPFTGNKKELQMLIDRINVSFTNHYPELVENDEKFMKEVRKSRKRLGL